MGVLGFLFCCDVRVMLMVLQLKGIYLLLVEVSLVKYS